MRRHSGGFTLIELMIVVAIIALLAAVAVPTFIRYVRRARSTEVYEALDKIAVGAKSYFHAEHHDAVAGLPLARVFPETVGWTPAASCCLQPAARCRPITANWQVPTWQTLHFMLENDHYYQYDFGSTGSDTGATFNTSALGNLDCDSTSATWRREGSVTADFEINVGYMIIEAAQEIE